MHWITHEISNKFNFDTSIFSILFSLILTKFPLFSAHFSISISNFAESGQQKKCEQFSFLDEFLAINLAQIFSKNLLQIKIYAVQLLPSPMVISILKPFDGISQGHFNRLLIERILFKFSSAFWLLLNKIESVLSIFSIGNGWILSHCKSWMPGAHRLRPSEIQQCERPKQSVFYRKIWQKFFWIHLHLKYFGQIA